jgi:hypothetical protein
VSANKILTLNDESASSIALLSHISINENQQQVADNSVISGVESTISLSDDSSVYSITESSEDILASPTGSTRSRRTVKRDVVEDFPTVDANGTAVLYTGTILQGRPSGKGRMRWPNGESYKGGFKQGQRHGKGVHTYSNGRRYEGRFMSNLPHDMNGQMTWKDGTIYVGGFVEGKRTGSGIQRFPSNVRYEGQFVDGKYHGRGICYFADGSIYSGDFIHGKAHGDGCLKDKYGKVLYSGPWQNDSPAPHQS